MCMYWQGNSYFHMHNCIWKSLLPNLIQILDQYHVKDLPWQNITLFPSPGFQNALCYEGAHQGSHLACTHTLEDLSRGSSNTQEAARYFGAGFSLRFESQLRIHGHVKRPYPPLQAA